MKKKQEENFDLNDTFNDPKYKFLNKVIIAQEDEIMRLTKQLIALKQSHWQESSPLNRN